MKLSIIVPVYNVAPYLRKCVDSLLLQDYEDYEIILVDDGSTDESGDICDEYARQKPTSNSSLKGRESFASVWGAHTADSTQYDLLEANAREQRKNPTEAESVMWGLLKGNNIGLHFRRQHLILDYIVDFICLEKGLIIELDGGYHNNPAQKENDAQRTAHLTKLGYTELRFSNEELLTEPEGVIERIKSVASSLPSLQGGVGGRPPIRVIHQQNRGLSAARNSGIEVAQGEYIMFVDSDDYIEPNVLGTLMEQVGGEQLDVLRFDYRNVRVVDAEHLDAARLESESLDATQLEYEVFEPNKHPHRADSQGDVVAGIDYLNRRMGYACYAWQFIIRRDIIINPQSTIHNQQSTINNLLFTEGIHFEDVDWLPRMMLKAQRVGSTTLIVYNYFAREGSITQVHGNKNKQRKNVENLMCIIEKYNTYVAQFPDCIWLKNMQSTMVSSLLTTVAQEFYSDRKGYLARLNAWHVFPLMIADQGRTYMRRAKLINTIGPRIYCWIMKIRANIK